MKLFRQDYRSQSDASRELFARFELIYTAVDFLAATFFIVGSIMFFSDEWQTFGIWMFLLGSFLFAAKPTIRMIREIKLYRMGDMDDLAERAKGLKR